MRGAEGLSIVSKGYSRYMSVLKSFDLMAIAPGNGKKEAVEWESSDPDIAKIVPVNTQDDRYKQVKVTLMYVGKATITAKSETGKTVVFEIDSKFPSALVIPPTTEIPNNPEDNIVFGN